MGIHVLPHSFNPTPPPDLSTLVPTVDSRLWKCCNLTSSLIWTGTGMQLHLTPEKPSPPWAPAGSSIKKRNATWWRPKSLDASWRWRQPQCHLVPLLFAEVGFWLRGPGEGNRWAVDTSKVIKTTCSCFPRFQNLKTDNLYSFPENEQPGSLSNIKNRELGWEVHCLCSSEDTAVIHHSPNPTWQLKPFSQRWHRFTFFLVLSWGWRDGFLSSIEALSV